MKCKNNDMARHIRVRAGVAYPAASVALVVSFALALTSFGPSQITASAATNAPTATATADVTTTTAAPGVTTTTAAPSVTTTAAPSATTTTAAPSVTTTAAPLPTPVPGASATAAVAPSDVPVDHHVLARIDDTKHQATYLPLDASVADAAQFQTFRVLFKLHNAGITPMTATPQLEYRTAGSATYTLVPEKPLTGAPVYVTREWVRSPGVGGGTVQGPLGDDIVVGDLRTGSEGGGVAVSGHRSTGANPDRPITLPPGAYTEQEFTITLSIDAQYLTGYEFRITEGGKALTGTQVAKIQLGPVPALQLSSGQHQGVAVGGAKPAIRTGMIK